jgi:hypothetical protein
MSHNILVRDDGGGIYSHPIPENFLNFGAFPYTISPLNFVRSIVASLVASTTAARASNVVTITATAHGVPTTYNGFRFYYPGSPTLAAGWVDNITVADANTITFPSIGANFSSESVNAGAAYVTATNISTPFMIPAGMVTDSSQGKIILSTTSSNTAATKTIRPFLGVTGFGPSQTGTTFQCSSKEWDFGMINATQMVSQINAPGNGGSSSLNSIFTFNPLVDNLVTIQLTISAAQDFLALISTPKMVIYR